MLKEESNFTFSSLTNATIEDAFESVRSVRFSHYPSRLKSLFAVKSIEDLNLWNDFFPKDGSPIWEIECDFEETHNFDARFLRGGFAAPFEETYEMAFRYWNGEHSDNYLPELLLSLPVLVIRKAGIFY